MTKGVDCHENPYGFSRNDGIRVILPLFLDYHETMPLAMTIAGQILAIPTQFHIKAIPQNLTMTTQLYAKLQPCNDENINDSTQK